jgi:hypothetical protein
VDPDRSDRFKERSVLTDGTSIGTEKPGDGRLGFSVKPKPFGLLDHDTPDALFSTHYDYAQTYYRFEQPLR